MDARKINVQSQQDLQLLINEIEGAQNKDRKAQAWKLYECLEDNQRPHVLAELARIYPDTFNKFRIGDINIVGKIVHKKSKAYKNAPIRKLINDSETKEYIKFLEEGQADRALKEFDKIFNTHKYAAFWVNYINPTTDLPTDKGRYVYSALAPYEYDLYRDQLTGEPLIFILHYPDTTITGGEDGIEQRIAESQKDTAAESKIYSIYTKDLKIKVKRIVPVTNGVADISKSKLEVIDMVENDLGILPIVFLSKDLAVDYPLPSQLANKAIDFNVSFSDLKTAASSQGHGQLVIEHPSGQAIETPHLGKHTAILLPQSQKEKDSPTKASYINASPDLGGQLSVLKFDLINILDDEGIQAKSAIEGGADNVKSGFDRLLKEADVQDIIENNQSIYAILEDRLFLIIKTIAEKLNRYKFKSETIQVTFEKPKVMISDSETLDNIKKRDEQGLLKSYEKHIIINPNLTEAEAMKREEEIAEEKKKKISEMSEAMGANSPIIEDEEEDETIIEE